jgi:hypothetical protein
MSNLSNFPGAGWLVVRGSMEPISPLTPIDLVGRRDGTGPRTLLVLQLWRCHAVSHGERDSALNRHRSRQLRRPHHRQSARNSELTTHSPGQWLW